MPPAFEQSASKGLIVGYSLQQDDDIDVEIHVGEPFTGQELAAGRWLEPQHSFLRLPSGALCIESNDANRIGPEPGSEEGRTVRVPPGDYRLTLLRVDHEALDREELKWKGPEEVILLTSGGSAADAFADLLPYEERRDLSWVGRYTVDGSTAQALAWFDDRSDTCHVNLDAAGLAAMGLTHGGYFRLRVHDAGLTYVGVFDASWELGKRRPPPANVELTESGWAATIRAQDWRGAETLFVRRELAAKEIAAKHQTVWLPAQVERLDPKRHPPRAAVGGVTGSDLRKKTWFADDFLPFILSEVMPEVADLEVLPLAKAIGRIDKTLAKLGLTPAGDVDWVHDSGAKRTEYCLRFYTGPGDHFAVIVAADGIFEILFVSELEDATFVVTGFATDLERVMTLKDGMGLPVPNPRIRFSNRDEPIAEIHAAHVAALGKGKARAAPGDSEGAAAAFTRLMDATR
jgi:hypothetical protein